MENEALLKTAASRFEEYGLNANEMHPDNNKHILAFEIIYCCDPYNLYEGINFTRPTSKEKPGILDKQEKERNLLKRLEDWKAKDIFLQEARSYLLSAYKTGVIIQHKKYGTGEVVSNDGAIVRVNFEAVGEKKLGLILSASNDIIRIDSDEYQEKMNVYKAILKEEEKIPKMIAMIQKDLEGLRK